MIYFILGAIFYFVPNLWVNYTLNKHNDILPNMPFSAKEFGEELLKEKGIVDDIYSDGHVNNNGNSSNINKRKKKDRKRTRKRKKY